MIRNRIEIVVHGMRRSGHHAVAQWVAYHFGAGEVVYCNNPPPGVCPMRGRQYGNWVPYLEEPYVPGSQLVEGQPMPHFRPDSGAVDGVRPCLMYNYEDCELQATEKGFDRTWTGISSRTVHLLVLRDPFNLLASRLQFAHLGFTPREDALSLWIDHALGYLHGSDRYLPVSYNRWFSDLRYRQLLSARLGLPWTDRCLEIVPLYAGGSSFEGRGFNGKAQAAPVLDRWRSWIGKAEYLTQVRRPVVRSLARSIFGELPAEKYLKDSC